jgi:hypothetical protein
MTNGASIGFMAHVAPAFRKKLAVWSTLNLTSRVGESTPVAQKKWRIISSASDPRKMARHELL